MKRIFYLSLILLLAKSSFSQAPQGINYQGVARNAAGQAMGMTNISVSIKLYQGNPNTGTLVYQEVHSPVGTDTFGLYSLTIGMGAPLGGLTFSQVPWSTGNIWVSVWIDPTGGSNYVLVANQQLMSVPYALYAATAGSGGGGINGTAHNIPKINPAGNGVKPSLLFESTDSSGVAIGNSSPNPNAVLDIKNTGVAGGAGKGVLIPRLTDSERNQIPVNALSHGLLVYQTNSPSPLSPEGFWYYDAIATSWLMLAPTQAVWTLGGNAVGTSAFLGSLDDQDIVFKTGFLSAIERMRILSNSNGGNVQFGLPGGEYRFPTVRGSVGDVLQMDPTGTNNLVWVPMGGSGPWSKTNGAVTLTNLFDTVGIGIANPQSQLHLENNLNQAGALIVTHNVTSSSPAVVFQTMNPANGSTVLDVSTVGGGTALNAVGTGGYGISTTSQNSSAIYATSGSVNQPAIDATNSGGHGAAFLQSTSDGTATLEGSNLGKHSVAYFHNAGTPGSGPVIYALQNDNTGYAAEFSGGLGIKTDGLEMPTGAVPGYILQSVSATGQAAWIDPSALGPWKISGTTLHPVSTGSVGIGTTNAQYDLHVVGNSPNPVLFSTNNGTGDAIVGNSFGTGNGVAGVSSGNGAGVLGIAGGASGNGGYFQVTSATSSVAALVANHQGAGPAAEFSLPSASNNADALRVFTSGGGACLFAQNTGTGSVANLSITNSNSTSSAFNVSTNGKSTAAQIQSLNASSTMPSLWVTQMANAPALKVDGGGNTGSVSGIFNGGAVGIGTGAAQPTSGLDVKTSIGVAVKKYTTAASYGITLTDQNTVHLCAASGSFTFTIPDATQCPGRILIFSADQTVTGGTMILQACCGQSINGSTSQSFGLTTGLTKPSIGLVSDGSNWQIIFKN
jgi:trimeric autotransporter adhesin